LKTKTKTEGPVVKKNRFPLATSHPDTDVLYQGITHTHQYLKLPINKGEFNIKQKKIILYDICITFYVYLQYK